MRMLLNYFYELILSDREIYMTKAAMRVLFEGKWNKNIYFIIENLEIQHRLNHCKCHISP